MELKDVNELVPRDLDNAAVRDAIRNVIKERDKLRAELTRRDELRQEKDNTKDQG